jgi:hypothetical protein
MSDDDVEPFQADVLRVRAGYDGSAPTIVVEGEFDLTGTERFWAFVSEALAEDPRAIIGDRRVRRLPETPAGHSSRLATPPAPAPLRDQRGAVPWERRATRGPSAQARYPDSRGHIRLTVPPRRGAGHGLAGGSRRSSPTPS